VKYGMQVGTQKWEKLQDGVCGIPLMSSLYIIKLGWDTERGAGFTPTQAFLIALPFPP